MVRASEQQGQSVYVYSTVEIVAFLKTFSQGSITREKKQEVLRYR
jgi:hypothetical protein